MQHQSDASDVSETIEWKDCFIPTDETSGQIVKSTFNIQSSYLRKMSKSLDQKHFSNLLASSDHSLLLKRASSWKDLGNVSTRTPTGLNTDVYVQSSSQQKYKSETNAPPEKHHESQIGQAVSTASINTSVTVSTAKPLHAHIFLFAIRNTCYTVFCVYNT